MSSFAHLRERIQTSVNRRRLYAQIARASSRTQRDELLVMAQRYER
ncbi:MAG: hypothetical protein QM662_15815 [Gordonia sp. (in: high G+C Gram-positive bacteria)]